MLRITKSGKLIKNEWEPLDDNDDDNTKYDYVDTDVTDSAFRRLFEQCELEEGVTLKDILLLLDEHIEIFDLVLGNWCKDFVAEGLDGVQKPYGAYDKEAIEYLELRYRVNYDPTEGLYGLTRLDFGGVGYVLREDPEDDFGHKKGERIPWGVSFTPVNELANIPIRISNEYAIYNDDIQDNVAWGTELFKGNSPETTLGQILEGIVWELSWHGPPKKRDVFGDSLKETVEKIKDGTIETTEYDLDVK